MAGKNLPAPLALVIQGWRGRIGISVGLLMLLQVAHRGEVFLAHCTTVLPLEGHGRRNPSRTTVIQGRRGRVGISVGSLMLPQVAHRGILFVTHAQLSYLQKVMAGKTLPALLALVIQGWRGRIGIGVRSLMLLQVAHRGKVLPTHSTFVLPLEGHGGQSPSRTTCTCDPGAEGARWDPCGFADASAGCSQR